MGPEAQMSGAPPWKSSMLGPGQLGPGAMYKINWHLLPKCRQHISISNTNIYIIICTFFNPAPQSQRAQRKPPIDIYPTNVSGIYSIQIRVLLGVVNPDWVISSYISNTVFTFGNMWLNNFEVCQGDVGGGVGGCGIKERNRAEGAGDWDVQGVFFSLGLPQKYLSTGKLI